MLKINNAVKFYWTGAELDLPLNVTTIQIMHLYAQINNAVKFYFYYLKWEWLLFNVNWAIIQLYHGENKLLFNELMMKSASYSHNTLSWIFIVIAHWNNSPRIDRHVAPLGHIILIPSQPVFALSS